MNTCATRYATCVEDTEDESTTVMVNGGAPIIVHLLHMGTLIGSVGGGDNSRVDLLEGDGTTVILRANLPILGAPFNLTEGPVLFDKGLTIVCNGRSTCAVAYSDGG